MLSGDIIFPTDWALCSIREKGPDEFNSGFFLSPASTTRGDVFSFSLSLHEILEEKPGKRWEPPYDFSPQEFHIFTRAWQFPRISNVSASLHDVPQKLPWHVSKPYVSLQVSVSVGWLFVPCVFCPVGSLLGPQKVMNLLHVYLVGLLWRWELFFFSSLRIFMLKLKPSIHSWLIYLSLLFKIDFS